MDNSSKFGLRANGHLNWRASELNRVSKRPESLPHLDDCELWNAS
jgi:hypothetical protein